MLDKKLIQNNFIKSLKTYDNYAFIQKKMAEKLILLLERKNFKNILEIGSYTGFLTKKINENFEFQNYLALDIINSFDYIKNINPKIKFQKIDIENFETEEKFDLIVANASLQWCNDFKKTIFKLKSFLTPDGVLAISIFGKKNLIEIKKTFNQGLDYFSLEELANIFSPRAKIIENEIMLKFQTPKEILEHLKFTGVNSIAKNNFSISQIKEKMEMLDKIYQNKLTYNPVFIMD